MSCRVNELAGSHAGVLQKGLNVTPRQRIAVGVTCWIIAVVFTLLLLTMPAGAASVWYVSRNGNNSSGQDWAGAWNELNRIRWDLVQPGDTIVIDGGNVPCPNLGDEPAGCGMVYNTALNWGQNGVTIKASTDAGRNGTVIIDGNQTTFVYCAENGNMPAPPRSPNGTPLATVVSFNGRNDATLSGEINGRIGIRIRNGVTYGINLGGGDRNTVRYVAVHHINNPNDTTNNSVGVTMGYTADDILLEYMEIYRNGQDAVRGTADNLTLQRSYIHDHYCNHPDGVQSFVPTNNAGVGTAEQVIENLVVRYNVFERVGLQQIFLGENVTHQSWVDGADINNNLMIGAFYGLKTKHGNTRNIDFWNNTVYGSREFAIEWCCASPGARAPMSIRNNIFYQTRNPSGTGFFLSTGGGTTAFVGNCLYQGGSRSGNVSESGTIILDPKFVDANAGNYALQQGSPCAGKGSAITSRLSLFLPNIITPTPATATPTRTSTPTHTQVTATPTATDTPTDTPTSTETPIPTDTPTATPTPTLSHCVGWRGGTPEVIPCP